MSFFDAFASELEKIAVARITPRSSAVYKPMSGADQRSWYDRRLAEAKQQRFEKQTHRAPLVGFNAESTPKGQASAQPVQQPLAPAPAPAPAVKPEPEKFTNIPNPALKKAQQPAPQDKAGPKSFFTRPAARTARAVRRVGAAAAEQAGAALPYAGVNMMQQWAAERAARKQQAAAQLQTGVQ